MIKSVFSRENQLSPVQVARDASAAWRRPCWQATPKSARHATSGMPGMVRAPGSRATSGVVGAHSEPGSRQEPLIVPASPHAFRPGHMTGATRRVTPLRQGGHRGGRWGHPNAQFTRGHEAYTPDTSSLHPDPPFPSPAPARRTWTTPCWLLGLHSGGAAGVRGWHTSS
jgi:hypothetical protein